VAGTVDAEHPFRRLWETRDLEGWGAVLAPDVVLNSPILSAPFRGRPLAIDLYRVLLDRLDDVEITHESEAGDVAVFAWRARHGGRVVEGVDFLRRDAGGAIAEVTVFLRPLRAVATFSEAIGAPFARRGGRLRGVLAAALVAPLRPLLALIDTLAARVLGLPR
jgi:ketosteroid isomerase-like protein